jgi:hypothetical protein
MNVIDKAIELATKRKKQEEEVWQARRQVELDEIKYIDKVYNMLIKLSEDINTKTELKSDIISNILHIYNSHEHVIMEVRLKNISNTKIYLELLHKDGVNFIKEEIHDIEGKFEEAFSEMLSKYL